MRKGLALLLALLLVLLIGCTEGELTLEGRTIIDCIDRQVSVPETVERIVCVGVGALRYTCYLGAEDLVVGVEDYETTPDITRMYSYVNAVRFGKLPVTGTNGVPDPEQILTVLPDVIVMSKSASWDAEDLQNKTGIPVVVIPGSDSTLDEACFETIRILGQLYAKEDRAEMLTSWLREIQQDLQDRTANVPQEEQPSVYVGGISYRGLHGFEGTEAGYGPLALIGARNLADTLQISGAFDIDQEQVLSWDPDVIFLDFNGMELIREDYEKNPDFYHALTAVQEGNVYSQISFRSYASNLETALADAYYAASVLYPRQFSDIDPAEKAGEIFRMLLGEDCYPDLKEAGYEFRALTIG